VSSVAATPAEVVGLTRPAELESTDARSHRRDIQGLRALAVLLVVAFHAGLPVPGGFFGVDVFFVISGFVITKMLVAELASTGRLRLGSFYARRVRRLLPALAVVLVFVAAAGALASPIGGQRAGAITGVAASLFGANLYLGSLHAGYFDPSPTLNPLLHTWTLAVEEQFYLLFPLLLLVCWRLGRRRSAAWARDVSTIAIACVGAGSLWLLWATVTGRGVLGHGGSQFAFYSSLTRAWEFAAGAVLALLARRIRALPLVAGAALGAAGIGLIVLAAAPAGGGAVAFRPFAALLAVGGASALLAAGIAPANSVTRLVGAAPLAWLGDLSYSWYLWHWPLIVFARALLPGRGWVAVAAAAGSLAPAYASYRFVENPVRHGARYRGHSVVKLAGACIAAPVLTALALVALHRALDRTTTFERWNRVERLHADSVLGCNASTPLGERTTSRCSWSVPNARGRVVLVGDSNAGHFTEPFVRAARRAGYDPTVATLSSCPFVRLQVEPGVGDFSKTCLHFVDATLATVLRMRPSLVVMAARSDDYVEGVETGLATPGAARLAHDRAAKLRLWRQGLESVLSSLSRAGIPVVVVHPLPALPATGPDSAVLRVLLGASPETVPRATVDRRLAGVRAAEDAAVAADPTASTLDFENAVCSASRCSSVQHGRFMYRDRTHLSIDGALTLTSRFYRAIDARAR
jgi:peptidoglycan/LPS O-acetylase OafA/YrhL